MFWNLLRKECRMWLKSIIFYAYVLILFLFYVTQMDGDILVKPQKGHDSYGQIYSTDKTDIMNGTLKILLDEYEWGTYATYPVGFLKNVNLSGKETKQIEQCISRLTKMRKKDWKSFMDEYNEKRSNDVEAAFPLSVRTDYAEFEKIMKNVSEIIGPGSSYSTENIKLNGETEKTYEQALQEYQEIIKKDKVTGAYARLFSDYLGIVLGMLPAFLAVSRVLKEKRSKVGMVVYSKKAGSVTIVLSRYMGIVIMSFLPVILVSCFSLAQSVYIAKAVKVVPDYLAYVKYAVGWLLPTILFVAALAYVIALGTESAISILVNGGVWMYAVCSSMILERAGWNLIPRFNALGEYSNYRAMYPQLVKNRILYTVLSLILVLLCIYIYDKKRGGKWYGTLSKAD